MSPNEPEQSTPKDEKTTTSGTRQSPRGNRQDHFLEAFLTEPTLKKAAERVGIGYATAKRWRKSKEFGQAVAAYREEAISQSIERLHHAYGLAVTTLSTIMSDPQAPAAARVTAARTVIEAGRQELKLEEQDAQLEELQEKTQLLESILMAQEAACNKSGQRL